MVYNKIIIYYYVFETGELCLFTAQKLFILLQNTDISGKRDIAGNSFHWGGPEKKMSDWNHWFHL